MTMSKFPVLLSAVLAFGFARVPSAQEGETDSLYMKDGSAEVGKVVEEGYTGVEFQPEKGAKKLVAWPTITSIDYFDTPEELTGAQAAVTGGSYDAAREQLQAVLAIEGLRPMHVQEAEYLLAYAQQRIGDVDAAIAGYDRLAKDFAKGRYLRSVGENLIGLHLLKGDAAGAQAALDKLTQGSKGTAGVEPMLGLLEGRLLEGQGKMAEARERYGAVETMAGIEPAMAQEARLGKARTLLHDSKGAEAEPIFRALIGESQDPRVQSGAWNGLGEIQATEGRAKKDGDRIQDALYAYLRTVVQYKPLPGESTEEYERALAGAGNCFKLLSEIEQNTEKKKLLRDRERERTEQLQREYPNSPFLKK